MRNEADGNRSAQISTRLEPELVRAVERHTRAERRGAGAWPRHSARP